MEKKRERNPKDGIPQKPETEKTPQRPKTQEELRRGYLEQIEFFKSINHNGAYDAVLEYLMEELNKLSKSNPPSSVAGEDEK